MTPGDWITGTLTGSLVIMTGYYAWQTRGTVAAMNEANEMRSRPVVSISLRPRKESISFVDFVVTNAGGGLARDISFEVIGKNFMVKEVGDRKEKLKDFRVIKNGIHALAPGETRSYWFLSMMGRVEEIQRLNTKVKVIYYNQDKEKEYCDTFAIDFLSLPEYSLGDDSLYKTSKELEKIRKELEQIRKSWVRRA